VDMWTIGFADRLRLPRFAKQARKAGGARLRPPPTGATANKGVDVYDPGGRITESMIAKAAIQAATETDRATP
jgi:hypothetical protein